MSTSKRRKIGGVLALIAVAVVTALALANVPLVTRSGTYFADTPTGWTRSSVHFHWALIIATVMFVTGVVIAFFPSRTKAT
jgi:hypothetical protein